MKQFAKNTLLFAACLNASIIFAAPPRQLITHNRTDVESNAYIAGTSPSRYPTKAHNDSKVIWTEVRMACFGHIVNGTCSALIRMATGPEDGGQPIDLGYVSLDMNTGMITPSHISAHGYSLTVNGPGETTLTKD